MKHWVALLGMSLGACGGEPCPAVIEEIPMTAERAKGIAPEVATGLAVSSTNVFGDCRILDMPPPMDRCTNVACVRRRESMRLLIVPVNMSVPNAPACQGGFAVADLEPLAERSMMTSAIGELVVPLDVGSHLAFLSADGVCADCGALGSGQPCLFEVKTDQVTTRDLVLDHSTR